MCGTAGDPAGLIDVIASLVDKSLVTATGDAEVRYRLLETVRAYAAERLAEAGEEEQVRAAHARYFLDLAEQGEPMLRSREQLTWLARLTAEHDNFAAALRYRDRRPGHRHRAAPGRRPGLVLDHARLRDGSRGVGDRGAGHGRRVRAAGAG